MIHQFDRVYVSCLGEHGRVSQVINTGIAGIKKYRVEFDNDRSGIYGEAFVQAAPVARSIARLRLAAVDGRVLA